MFPLTLLLYLAPQVGWKARRRGLRQPRRPQRCGISTNAPLLNLAADFPACNYMAPRRYLAGTAVGRVQDAAQQRPRNR
jgi:hypothetical protein